MKVKLALIALCFPYAALFAQSSEKVVTRSTMVGIGSTNVLDTYLSDEHFKGTGVSFLATVERQRTDKKWATIMEHETDKKWATIMEHEGNISSCNSRHTQQELEGAYNFYWGKIYRWQLLDGALSLQAGGLLNASLGFIYNTSNGNNPAQARAHLNVMPTGVASYRFQLFNKQFVARYELALPLAGICFSPNYGQSYYEIFNRGDYDHNAAIWVTSSSRKLTTYASTSGRTVFSLASPNVSVSLLARYEEKRTLSSFTSHTSLTSILCRY